MIACRRNGKGLILAGSQKIKRFLIFKNKGFKTRSKDCGFILKTPKENNIANFNPDFIFWAQRGERYLILFVDPKGTSFAAYQHKIDGYKKIFEGKVFSYNGYRISTNLLLYAKSIAEIGEGYRKYWFDNFVNFATKLAIAFKDKANVVALSS